MKLAVIADDLTGALDTGVKFAGSPGGVQVWAGGAFQPQDATGDVVVVDGELRHKSPKQAREECAALVRRVLEAGAERLYIKTDSALRGNIGPMFQGALDASGWGFAAFAPAFPQMDRVTRKGIHYIQGVPIHQSVFGQDPFEPVRSSRVADLFRDFSGDVRMFAPGDPVEVEGNGPTLGIFDGECLADFHRIAAALERAGRLRLLGGCAGFASQLAGILGLTGGARRLEPVKKPLLVLCGSLNPISKEQLSQGERQGDVRLTLESGLLTPAQVEGPQGDALEGRILEAMEPGRDVLLDTAGPVPGREAEGSRETVAQALGALLFRLLRRPEIEGFQPMVVGGDTLMGLMDRLPAAQLSPLAEPVPGVVLSQVQVEAGKERALLSKSGGFGGRDLFSQLKSALEQGPAFGPFQG